MEGFTGDQVRFDMDMFPAEAPSKTPAPKKAAAAPKARKVTAADIKAVDELAGIARHEKEAAEKTGIVRRVKKYIKTFDMDVKLPRGFGVKMSLEELRDIERNVTLDLHTQGSLDMAAGLFVNGMSLIQRVSQWYNPLGLALSGPRADLEGTVQAQQKQWLPIMQELAIKYEDRFAAGPERRLFFYLISVVTLVHQANTHAQTVEVKKENLNKPGAPNLVKEMDEIFSTK